MSARKRILGVSDSKSVFVPEWQRPELFELMVSLVPQSERPRICYVGAAKGDSPERIAQFFELAQRVGSEPSALKLFNMTTDDPEEYFYGADIIFIDGGATRNLLALMREWDAIEPLKRAYDSGVLIVGASAGISILFDWCVSDSIRTRITPVRGIGVLRGTVCAHYDARAERRDVLSQLVQNQNDALPAYGIMDGVALLFTDSELETVYTTRANAGVHVFTNDDQLQHQKVVGTPISNEVPSIAAIRVDHSH